MLKQNLRFESSINIILEKIINLAVELAKMLLFSNK